MSPDVRRVVIASQDPAITFTALIPLALLHLSAWEQAPNGAFGMVENFFAWAGEPAYWALGGALVLAVFWALGRIRSLDLPCGRGVLVMLTEGMVWGALLGPVLILLTDWLAPGLDQPLSILGSETHGLLARAAGAGLYEELIFRAGLMTGGVLLFRALFRALGWLRVASWVAYVLALLFSAIAFALAHKLGDPNALEPRVFAFRFIAGLLLGGLYAWRGLGVVAYAHAAYDAYLLFVIL